MDERLPLPSVFGLLLDTNDQDQWPPEATLIAAYDGNVRRLKEIARGLDVNGRGVDSVLRRTTFKGMDALHAAAGGKGKLPICRYLVEEAKMDVNKRDTFKGKSMTPLQHAVFSGNLPIVRFLLDRGADLHQEGSLEGYDGLTALHTAAQKGWCEIAKLLLSRGAYVDGKSCHMTPLQLAVHGGHDSTLKVLLDHNADPNKEVNLSTPLTIALRTPSLSCLKLLIQARAEVNGIGNPLARAAQEGLTEAIKCLLEAGANPNTTDWCGKFPVELAAVYGTREDVEILFPCTSPIPTLTNWSIDGIINHMEPERKQREDDDFVEARKSDLKRHGGDAFKKQDYINSSAFYTQAVKVCNTFGRTNKIWGGTHTRKHSSTVRAQMAFVLVVLSFAYLPLLPLAMATATITMKMELCNPHALATHILHSCPGVSNPSATQCCDRLVLAVDEEGGGRCLCRAVAEMAKVGEARTYNQLARLYLDCGGLNAEAVHRHKCSGNATGWTGTAVAPKQSPPAVKAAMKGQPGHGSSAPIPRLFMNGWKAMLEAFLAALSPALLFLAYQFGLLCAKWITWVYKWLSDWISPMAGSPGSTVQLQQIVTERPAIAQKDSHVCPSDTNMLSRRSLPSPHAGDDQKAVEDDLRRKAQRLKEYELGPISADTDEIFEEYGTPCSVLAQAAELDRLLPTVQNQKYE